MGNLSGESREQNRKDKVTRFPSVTYAIQLGLLVNTLGSQPYPELKVPTLGFNCHSLETFLSQPCPDCYNCSIY